MVIVDMRQHRTDKLQKDHQVLVDADYSGTRCCALQSLLLAHEPHDPLHDMGVFARVDAGHRDAEGGVCLDGDGLAGVLRADRVEEARGRERGARGRVAADPDAGRLVVLVVGDG